jgi:hypothetical protein
MSRNPGPDWGKNGQRDGPSDISSRPVEALNRIRSPPILSVDAEERSKPSIPNFLDRQYVR